MYYIKYLSVFLPEDTYPELKKKNVTGLESDQGVSGRWF